MNDNVKFGLKNIPKSEKTDKVSEVFSSVAKKYDLMNDLMSLGQHRLWKEKLHLTAKIRSNEDILDVASGTGDLALKFMEKNKNISVTCLDENKEMLEICKDRLLDNGFFKNLSFINSSIEKFSKSENKYNLVTISFGFRNFTDHDKALKNIYKSLKPGGRLIIMDFKNPNNGILRKIFSSYTDNILPVLGEKVVGDSESYRYLSDSIKTYMSVDQVTQLLSRTGFINIKSESMPGDFVSIHLGYKS